MLFSCHKTSNMAFMQSTHIKNKVNDFIFVKTFEFIFTECCGADNAPKYQLAVTDYEVRALTLYRGKTAMSVSSQGQDAKWHSI